VTLYCIVRHLKRSGSLKLVADLVLVSPALPVAKSGGRHLTECLFIEPYPSEYLKEFNLYGELLVKKIEEVPLSRFEQLEAGDILFIDTPTLSRHKATVVMTVGDHSGLAPRRVDPCA